MLAFGVGIILIILSFFLFILGVMHFIPVAAGSLALFFSILFTVHCLNERNKFKGIS
ncbi:hypothetical protein ACFPU1_06835 [Thalassorhabdus alkalitolerans]|uniref:Uncharacterized protein n=1 Tax=Thalassorhabdus alkalitolerans TaxID=2282697 RepID=A0ABW0YL70_9BACI|nr:hypothetical protein [Thalassobacillus sp. C254]